MKSSAACALAIVLATTASCGGDDDDDGAPIEPDASVVAQPDAAPLSASCVEAMDKSDILWIQDNIFNSCAAFSACHGAVTPAGGLNLESGFAEAAMLNVDSVLFPEYKLVVPGDPENSYLMTILGAVDGPLSDDVGTMPYNNPTLCQPKLDAIGRWISALPQ